MRPNMQTLLTRVSTDWTICTRAFHIFESNPVLFSTLSNYSKVSCNDAPHTCSTKMVHASKTTMSFMTE